MVRLQGLGLVASESPDTAAENGAFILFIGLSPPTLALVLLSSASSFLRALNPCPNLPRPVPHAALISPQPIKYSFGSHVLSCVLTTLPRKRQRTRPL